MRWFLSRILFPSFESVAHFIPNDVVGCTERSILAFSVVFSSLFATQGVLERKVGVHLQSSVDTKIRADTQHRSRNDSFGGASAGQNCPESVLTSKQSVVRKATQNVPQN